MHEVTHVWHMCNLHAYQLLHATCKLFTHVQTTCVCYISKLHICMLLWCHMCVTWICAGYACSACMPLHMCMLLWCHMCVIEHMYTMLLWCYPAFKRDVLMWLLIFFCWRSLYITLDKLESYGIVERLQALQCFCNLNQSIWNQLQFAIWKSTR